MLTFTIPVVVTMSTAGSGGGDGGGGGKEIEKGRKGRPNRCPRCGNRYHGDSDCWVVCGRCGIRHHPERNCPEADAGRGGGRGGESTLPHFMGSGNTQFLVFPGGGGSTLPLLVRSQHTNVYVWTGGRKDLGGGLGATSTALGGTMPGGGGRIEKPGEGKKPAKQGRNARRRANFEERVRAGVEAALAARSGSGQPTNQTEPDPTAPTAPENSGAEVNLGSGGENLETNADPTTGDPEGQNTLPPDTQSGAEETAEESGGVSIYPPTQAENSDEKE